MASTTPPDNGNKPANSYAKYSGIAIQMFAIIGVFAYVGYKIDENAAHQTKWVTATLALVGVFISLYLVIRSLKE